LPGELLIGGLLIYWRIADLFGDCRLADLFADLHINQSANKS
jgi:hypothetical protein